MKNRKMFRGFTLVMAIVMVLSVFSCLSFVSAEEEIVKNGTFAYANGDSSFEGWSLEEGFSASKIHPFRRRHDRSWSAADNRSCS